MDQRVRRGGFKASKQHHSSLLRLFPAPAASPKDPTFYSVASADGYRKFWKVHGRALYGARPCSTTLSNQSLRNRLESVFKVKALHGRALYGARPCRLRLCPSTVLCTAGASEENWSARPCMSAARPVQSCTAYALPVFPGKTALHGRALPSARPCTYVSTAASSFQQQFCPFSIHFISGLPFRPANS